VSKVAAVEKRAKIAKPDVSLLQTFNFKGQDKRRQDKRLFQYGTGSQEAGSKVKRSSDRQIIALFGSRGH